jgi:serine/threonine protein kinase
MNDDLIGKEVAGFQIVREIARGGMGIVLEAEQVRLGRPVALKVLHPALTIDDGFLRRFEREAKTLARLNHENIVNVIDYFLHEGRYFLALEFVEGETLARRLRRCARRNRFFSAHEAAVVTWQIAQAVAFAHGRGIIHRDLKPDNIMLTPRGRAKVMDFGIARILATDRASDTEVGTRVGTPDYMSPEQLRGRAADARSDLFALGMIFYEMMAGSRPYTQADLLKADLDGESEIPWDTAALPPGSDRMRPILERMLAPAPANRYETAAALIDDMRARLGNEFLGDEAWSTPVLAPAEPAEAEPGRPVPSPAPAPPQGAIRRWWPVIAAIVVILIAAAGLGVYYHVQQGRITQRTTELEATMANFQGFILDSQGRKTEAESSFLRAITVNPSVPRYWRDLGDFYYKDEKFDEAAYYYRRTLERDPKDAETARRLREIEPKLTPEQR